MLSTCETTVGIALSRPPFRSNLYTWRYLHLSTTLRLKDCYASDSILELYSLAGVTCKDPFLI
jgi:hypothetical protein